MCCDADSLSKPAPIIQQMLMMLDIDIVTMTVHRTEAESLRTDSAGPGGSLHQPLGWSQGSPCPLHEICEMALGI